MQRIYELDRRGNSPDDRMPIFTQSPNAQCDDMLRFDAEAMKQMASEMHNELEATRNELRRGVLEMPQEAADSAAQMRK